MLRIRENSNTRARFARSPLAVIRHYEYEHHLRATVDISRQNSSADQLTWRARQTNAN
jgi:predicted metallo-beta-lactamase superfamily hydrolase